MIIVKTLALGIVAALFAVSSLSTIARAGSYDNDDSGYSDDNNNSQDYSDDEAPSYRHHSHHQHYCHWKRVKWYDDDGYKHYKRVKICN